MVGFIWFVKRSPVKNNYTPSVLVGAIQARVLMDEENGLYLVYRGARNEYIAECFVKNWQHIPLYTCYNIVMICPLCSQTAMVPIAYGMPTPMLIEMSQRDEIVLGGPVHKTFTHFCHYCQETYPQKED